MKVYSLYLLCAFICIYPSCVFAQHNDIARWQSQLQQQHLVFIENKGQVVDQAGHQRTDIRYKLSGKGINIFIGNGQLHYQFSRTEVDKSMSASANDITNQNMHCKPCKTITYRMDVTLVGANQRAQVITGEPQVYHENYFLPQCSGAVASSYNKITYKDIYPNIDWVLYIKDDHLEYDFIVRPGGNPDDIKLQYDGATNLFKKEDNIVARTPFGNISEQGLYAYEQQTMQAVAANFELNKNIVRFHVADYKGTVVIDPSLVWGTYYGGAEYDQISGIAFHDADNVFIAGTTSSASNIATAGSYKDTISGNYDVFLARFTSSGIRIWATYYGGSKDDYLNGYLVGNSSHEEVAIDKAGNIYITGTTKSNASIATPGCFQDTLGGRYDAFLAKFNNSGSLIWATYYGGDDSTDGTSVVSDTANHVYICGSTSSDGLATSHGFRTGRSRFTDIYFAKFDTAGRRVWGTYYGGTGSDLGESMAMDLMGNIYLGGTTSSDTGIATDGSFQETLGGVTNAFMAKFDTAGNRLWATYYGNSLSTITHVTCDIFNNVFMAFGTFDAGLATSGTYNESIEYPYAAVLSKFNSSGKRQWATYINKNQFYDPNIRIDETGCVYFTQLFPYGGPFPGGKLFLLKFDPFGRTILDSIYYGLSSGGVLPYLYFTRPMCMELTVDGYIYIGGDTNSPDSVATPDGYDTTLGGNYDGFLIKFRADTSVIINQAYNDTLICRGGSFYVPYLVNNSFLSGNTFTVQLSDAYGNFSSPVNIGSVAATGAGSILCTIPTGIAVGNGYRFRIVASNPAYISPDNGFNIIIANAISRVRITTNSPVCIDDTLSLHATSTTGAFYHWTGPAAFSSPLESPEIIPFTAANAGEYYVTVSAPGCPALHDSTAVAINPAVVSSVSISIDPDSAFSYGIYHSFNANAVNVGLSPTFKWYINGMLADSGTIYESLYTDSVKTGDIVTVVVESGDPCSLPHTISANTYPLALQQVSADKSIVLYPNPNTGSFTVKGALNDATADNVVLQIINAFGQVVYTNKISVAGGTFTKELNLADKLPGGFYILKVNTANKYYILSFSIR